MRPLWVIGLPLFLLALVVTVPAGAWQEVHELGQDVTVRVASNGSASVDEKVRWRVVRGPLKFIELGCVDGIALEPTVKVSAEDGHDIPAHVARMDPRTVRVTLDDPRAAMRGTVTFDLSWREDLTASHALVREAATFRLTWAAPPAIDGLDSAHTVFDFPAAADPPRPILPETGVVDEGAVATLRRDPGRDVLELVRPHIARGESAEWAVRIDPRAFLPSVAAAFVPPDVPALVEPDRTRETLLFACLALLAASFGFLVRVKTRAFAALCAACKVQPRALLPLADWPRAAFAGAALAAGVALQLEGRSNLGGALVGLAALGAALRCPAMKPVVRGPGRWLALRPGEAFAHPTASGHWMDLGSRKGKATFFCALLLLAGLARLASLVAVQGAWLVAMDSTALLPLFVTGGSSQLPPYGSASVWLARVFRSLRAVARIRAVPWGRVALDSSIDEVRILVLPRAPVPGVVGIEVGHAWNTTPVGWASVPELLVRALEGSAAAAKLSLFASELRVAPMPGRRSNERVIRVVPRGASVANAVALVRLLASDLTDRRTAEGRWAPPDGRERRSTRPTQTCPGHQTDVLEPRDSMYGA